ncbi:TPA: DUF1673 domain-containing protein [Methanosarcina acetivorans]|uniref:DUF1673 domain-containing protein n=3 Tax=Methanosarcina acetivorans TaxID=2214 RepID=Q8THM7_METAC|nr:DUF1673 domain-containing protein [Methanosarcina acetivorans]AAM07827.1 predicted protein [Methanosarcina acetivorans C2A]HIH94200.1 DUF1673 domain-containing protein [Methanosarcina acetivorans]
MTMTLEYIKKLMGWCPNAKAFETRRSVCPEYLEADNQSRGKDAGNSPVPSPGWWNKRHNRSLIDSSVFTLFSIYLIGFQGVSPVDERFMSGVILGIIFNLSLCIRTWSYLDDIKNSSRQRKIITVSSKEKIIKLINIIIALVILYLLFSQFNWGFVLFLISAFCLIALLYYFKFDFSPMVFLFYLGSPNTVFSSGIAGICLTAFLYYLTDVYWEKRNGKIVLVYDRKMSEICIVNAEAE